MPSAAFISDIHGNLEALRAVENRGALGIARKTIQAINGVLRYAVQTGKATYWSRSRNELWVKGETSGNVQRVKEIRIDCDNDTILLMVFPA